jgi:hypothetical protein
MSPIEKKHRAQMNAIMQALTEVFPGYGVALMVFDTRESDQPRKSGRINYICNADRESMLVALKEFIARHEGMVVDGPTMPQ